MTYQPITRGVICPTVTPSSPTATSTRRIIQDLRDNPCDNAGESDDPHNRHPLIALTRNSGDKALRSGIIAV